MLTLSQRQKVLAFWRYFNKFSLFPMSIEPDRWTLHPGAPTRWQACVCTASFALFFAHNLYIVLSFFHALYYSNGAPVHELIIHGLFACDAVMLSFWAYTLYIRGGHETAEFVRITLTAKFAAGNSYVHSEVEV